MFRLRVANVAALGLTLLVTACGRKAQDPVVISLDERAVPLSEVVFEFNRLKGVDQWAKTSEEGRRTFVETYAKKELLVRNARQLYGPELTGRERLIFNRWLEKQVYPRFWQRQRDAIEYPASLLDSLRGAMREQRYLRQVVCEKEATARQVYAEVQAGGDIQQIGEAYAERPPERARWADVGWVLASQLATPVAKALFGLSQAGEVAEPTRTERYGWHVIELHGIRPADPAAVDAAVEQQAWRIYRVPIVTRKADAIRQKYAFRVVRDAIPVIQRGFGAMFDSLNHVGKVDFQGLEPPMERFSPAELGQPLAHWSGGTMTIRDFVESLKQIDLDFWPTMGDTTKIRTQIESRLTRWTIMREAEAAQLPEEPEFAVEVRRKTQELYLERFHRDHLEVYGKNVTDADVADYWQKRGEEYRSRDLVGYGFLRFPAEDRELAGQIHERLQSGTDWGMGATQARRKDPRVVFESAIDPTDGPPYPQVTALALKYEVQPDGKPTITEPLELEGDWVILRIVFRSHPRTLQYEQAEPFVRRDLQRLAMEDTLRAVVKDLGRTYKLKINWKSLS